MATTPLRLWIASEANSLLSNPSSFVGANPPTFYAGNTTSLELYLLSGAGVSRTPYEVPFPAGATIKVSVGSVNAYPTAGNWKLSVSSVETVDLAYNATAITIQNALNDIPSVMAEGGVTVIDIGEGYSITWNTFGVKPEIVPGSNTLTPSSYQAITIVQIGSVSSREIRMVELRQNPVALTTDFEPVGIPVISVSTVSAWNGTNKVVRYEIDPQPKSGNYTITVNGKSAVISSTAGDSAILIAFTTANVTEIQSITRVGQLAFDLVLSSDVTVTANASGLISSYGYKGNISFATTEVIEFLGGAESKQSTLEVTLIVNNIPQTLVQSTCRILASVVSPGALEPVPMGTILTEEIANTRFIRQDIVSSPGVASQDVIWQNLGVTSDGSETVAAINNAQSASSGNPFLTLSDGNSRYATFGYNPFDQDLNTVDNVRFGDVKVGVSGSLNEVQSSSTGIKFLETNSVVSLIDKNGATFGNTIYSSTGITFPDLTTQSTAATTPDLTPYLLSSSAATIYQTLSGMVNYLTVTDATLTYAPLAMFDQPLFTTSEVLFGGINIGSGGCIINPDLIYGNPAITLASGWKVSIQGGGIDTILDWDGLTINGTAGINLFGGGSITFADSTTQNTRVVREEIANTSGYAPAFITHYPYEVKVISDTGTAYWVPARLA